jgi:hypothetical protein
MAAYWESRFKKKDRALKEKDAALRELRTQLDAASALESTLSPPPTEGEGGVRRERWAAPSPPPTEGEAPVAVVLGSGEDEDAWVETSSDAGPQVEARAEGETAGVASAGSSTAGSHDAAAAAAAALSRLRVRAGAGAPPEGQGETGAHTTRSG